MCAFECAFFDGGLIPPKQHELPVLALHSCRVFVGFLFVAFAVWTTFGREPPLNCRLAVLNTFLMASLESGDFSFGNVVLFKQDILVCHVFMAADFCFVIAAFDNPEKKWPGFQTVRLAGASARRPVLMLRRGVS